MRRLITVSVLAVLALPPTKASDFATRVLAYNPTNGVSGYTDRPENVLGPPSTTATPGTPDNTSLVSFGWGGSLILGFDRPIRNDPAHPGGYDFIIFGNTLYTAEDDSAPNREPGYVEVGIDPSGRHEYGDGSTVVWYWLKGQPSPASRAGYPVALPPMDATVWGYADCTPTLGTGDPRVPDDPHMPGISEGSAGGDAFDLSWAVDSNGAPVVLPYVDFVRITCAVNAFHPVTGIVSTEVDAVSLVRPVYLGDLDGDGAVTLRDAARIARYVGGLETLSDDEKRRVVLVGEPSLAHAAGILRTCAGL